MFGYVVVDKPNMLFKDFAEYRAYYCGLCKAIGKTQGIKYKSIVNYDMTFLAMLAYNVLKIKPQITPQRCGLNPLKKRPIALVDPVLEAVSRVNMLLFCHKIRDNHADSRGFRRGFYGVLRGVFSVKYRKNRVLFAPLDAVFRAKFALFNAKNQSLNAYADLFGDILKEIGKFMFGKNPSENADLACSLLYELGRWIYVIDALDDFDKDKKHGEFNPINTTSEIVGKDLLLKVKTIAEIYDRMDITIAEGPLSNIIYKGLYAKTMAVIAKNGQGCENCKRGSTKRKAKTGKSEQAK